MTHGGPNATETLFPAGRLSHMWRPSERSWQAGSANERGGFPPSSRGRSPCRGLLEGCGDQLHSLAFLQHLQETNPRSLRTWVGIGRWLCAVTLHGGGAPGADLGRLGVALGWR